MARTKRPNPFLENPPSASTSEEDAEKRGRGGAVDESDSDSDDVLKKFHRDGADFDSDKLPKKPKSKPNVEPPEPKKLNAERVWSEKDEIVVLEGLRDWKNKGKTWNKEKGWIPANALGEFLNGIKESLHFFPDTKTQLYPKIQKLKIRYFNAMKNKYTDGDEDPVFEKPHDIRLYLISKDIWSDLYKKMKEMEENTGKTAVGDNVEAKWGELLANLPMSGNLPKFGMKECLSKEGLKLIGDSKVKEFEKKWKKLHAEELDINLKRMKLVRETIEAVLGAVKASKD
ncbi:hypothetical protein C5167_012735 [Papaver somniferum]|uniref:Glabrous enhancer-binding protein-like DBD domain-containing protein n=1 Tax=Papaver somniferum TaxID=3469 RepID=A0A4Y7J0C5_PAPSO|nr:probable transcription factor At1g11510 [Papaver somniferum]RZC53886.1 hypothetical protein C5167_012735 [Papaver somniferum]